LYNL